MVRKIGGVGEWIWEREMVRPPVLHMEAQVRIFGKVREGEKWRGRCNTFIDIKFWQGEFALNAYSL
jgi:hypothetical protein